MVELSTCIWNVFHLCLSCEILHVLAKQWSNMMMKNINTVILLPLRPASLIHKNPPKCTNVYGSIPCRTKRSIDRSEDVFCRISCSCDFCGYSPGHCWMMHNSLRLCCALQKNICYLSGHIKGQGINCKLGLPVFWTGTHWFWTRTQNFSQDESQDSL